MKALPDRDPHWSATDDPSATGPEVAGLDVAGEPQGLRRVDLLLALNTPLPPDNPEDSE